MLGVHFALTPDQARELLEADGDDEEVAELLSELEENWSEAALKVDSDKAWDAIHRCLTGGGLDPDAGAFPLSHVIAGGRHLHDESYVVYVTAAEVPAVAAALAGLDRAWLRPRFDAMDDDYDGPADDGDFEYTWDNLADIRDFYARAATAGRAVIFTAT